MKTLIAQLVKWFAAFLGLAWLRGDAVKDARAKADLKAHERLNNVPDTSDLSDAERVRELERIAERLGV